MPKCNFVHSEILTQQKNMKYFRKSEKVWTSVSNFQVGYHAPVIDSKGRLYMEDHYDDKKKHTCHVLESPRKTQHN